jgi:hypothetical protein
MKMIYIVSYWLPFPASEYGGVQVVIAENDEECVQVLIEGLTLGRKKLTQTKPTAYREIHAKNIFPDEPEPTRYARIYFKTVYEFKEVSDD